MQRFDVRGMHCRGCADRIRGKILALGGVADARVSYESGVAEVEADAASGALVDAERIAEAVRAAGDYTATPLDPARGHDEDATTEPDRTAAADAPPAATEPRPESLYPLFLIVAFIAGTTLLIAAATADWSPATLGRHFMAGFFLVFSFFKLLDLRGFVSAYRGYDLVAAAAPPWAWAYPFVELALGAAYVLAFAPLAVNAATLVLMLVGAAGVLRALLRKQKLRCACLGTALNLPMTTVTLVEDLTMAGMAAAMLALHAA